ncbi:NADP-dependent oxidoreductase domain-containing protein [Dipodascopsis tothii]|uniref:NADP-dependent oxidoreductase domain-containing protein n=1 Tax=Dipodascopsis tothii TaxID=44089 RepID=UPI0034CF9830
MLTSSRSFTLNTGAKIPAVGLGTWQSTAENGVYNAVLTALKAGYRHIDTAFVYGNEAEVGQALKDSGVPRGEIFLTTKLWNADHADPAAALETSLKKLGTDYVDLYLIHWPLAFVSGQGLFPRKEDGSVELLEKSFVDTWKDVQALDKTKARAVGVSNFSVKNLEILLAAPSTTTVPAVNQVELHPYLPQFELLEFAKSKGIHITAYSPLGSTDAPLQNESVIQEIAAKTGKTPAQVLISWAATRGSVIPKSVTPSRIESNFQDFELAAEDVAAINEISKTTARRVVDPQWGAPIFA